MSELILRGETLTFDLMAHNVSMNPKVTTATVTLVHQEPVQGEESVVHFAHTTVRDTADLLNEDDPINSILDEARKALVAALALQGGVIVDGETEWTP